MELHEIRYFLALSKTLNFTKAAEACNVSQPALTRAIQKMETELGGLLFSRERNNTQLTELGQLLQPHLAEVVSRTRAAKETASRFLRLDSAQLKLGVMCTIGPVRFVRFLSRFSADNPGVDITLTEAAPDRLCDLLVKGDLDAALLAKPDGYASKLRPQPLYTERFVVACSPRHPFARRNVVRMAELDGEPYLARMNCEYNDALRDICHANGARPLGLFRSEREDWILTMVAAGMGVCFVPEYSSTIPGVISRHVIDPAIRREVCLVTVAGRRWSSPLSAFVRAVRKHRWPDAPMPRDDEAGAEDDMIGTAGVAIVVGGQAMMVAPPAPPDARLAR
jgi:DNA-binding transcriptional LysR family regulator